MLTTITRGPGVIARPCGGGGQGRELTTETEVGLR